MTGQDNVLRTLRTQAWERAKGELNSVLLTFYGKNNSQQFEQLDKAIREFVENVEENGLQE